ncbi:MAG: aminopeptidase P family N-terminal domain-containing protein, partial [Eggerthellaceae bacterium]|nr:aminopeptidase P family N-terminal domain-containing protein [Eggerthellaceae bacterium]
MDRIERLQGLMAGQGIDALCVRDTPNIAYLTGFQGVFDEERAHALLIDGDQVVLHTDSRYAAACRACAGDGPIQVDDATKTHASWLADRVGAGALGIEDTIALCEFRKLEEAFAESDVRLVETDGVVLRLRQVKGKDEVALLKHAHSITDAACAHRATFARPGMTERE